MGAREPIELDTSNGFGSDGKPDVEGRKNEVGMVAQERMRLPRDRVVRGRDASSELSTRLIHLPFSTAQPQRTVARVSPRNHLYGSAVGMVNE